MLIKTGKKCFLIDNREGSIIVIALMLLAIMTIIGISATDTAVTESFIIRNMAIRKQNISLVETAAVEALQDLIQTTDTDNLRENLPSPPRFSWINPDDSWAAAGNDTDWYDEMYAGRVLDADANWMVPNSVLNDNLSLINTRGEKGNNPLRVALVGWDAAPGSSLKYTGATRKKGRILAEYVSPDNGLVRLEVGIERKF